MRCSCSIAPCAHGVSCRRSSSARAGLVRHRRRRECPAGCRCARLVLDRGRNCRLDFMNKNTEQRVVMVVEPDVLARMVVADYLRECGYKVIEGVAAADVWAVLQSGGHMDVLLAD